MQKECLNFDCKIQKLLINFDLANLYLLPKIILKNENYYNENLIPEKICGLYFLFHDNDGLLYIGKSINLRSRWSIVKNYKTGEIITSHKMLQRSLEHQNVMLAWNEMPRHYSDLLEPILIKRFKPAWNTVGLK